VLSKLKNHERGILVNGQRVTVRYVLRAGDLLELADRDTPENATEHVIPCALPLDILYEDDHVIALNKPAHMPTHPSHGHLCDTLANALAYRYAEAEEPFVFRPLGRLDRNTSGVVVAGKTRAASGCLGRSLKNGEVIKRYLAILEGEMPVDGVPHTLEAPIYHPADTGIRRVVGEGEGAVYAKTVYRVLAAGGGLSLVLCRPVTGRTHQLRVHFSHLGHPILGDDVYGTPSPLIPRHALHAVSLSVPMPFARMRPDVAEGAEPLAGVSPHLPLNCPTPDGYLHTWAPLPSDMIRVLEDFFPAIPQLTAPPTVETLIRFPIPERT
jgi:23S rRNA pseudouridine1911/1915/1917 synthase